MKHVRLVATSILLTGLFTSACSSGFYRIEKADPATHRTLPSGEIVGGAGRYGSHAWLGIPFAEPPVGDLRWRAPRPAKPWTGVREALAPGAPCPQFASEFGGVEGSRGEIVGSEDCLYLNVYAPPVTGAGGLPVMVWIHGGGNSIGTANGYDGGNLAASEHVIVVNVQYRLGGLGWFRHAALRADTAGTDEDRSGNFGTLDHIQALRWVHDNIAAFGGNPGNVTIFGESAGGRNVYDLLVSPAAHGLFHRAIVESGLLACSSNSEAENLTTDAEPGHKHSSSEVLLELLTNDHAGDRAAAVKQYASMSSAAVAAYLRGKSVAEILSVYHPGALPMYRFPQVFADGTVISSDCGAALGRAGAWNEVPVMVGTNRDEMRLFLFANPNIVKRYFGLVPSLRIPRADYVAMARYSSRWWKATGADEPAQQMTDGGGKVFVYRFDWDDEPKLFGSDLSFYIGAAHGIEIPFVFGHFDLGTQSKLLFPGKTLESRVALSKQMMGYWAAFARNGDPGSGGAPGNPVWLPWDKDGRFIVFNRPAKGGVRLAQGTETRQKLLDEVVGLANVPVEKRCEYVRRFAGWSSTFHVEDEKRLACGAGSAISPIE